MGTQRWIVDVWGPTRGVAFGIAIGWLLGWGLESELLGGWFQPPSDVPGVSPPSSDASVGDPPGKDAPATEAPGKNPPAANPAATDRPVGDPAVPQAVPIDMGVMPGDEEGIAVIEVGGVMRVVGMAGEALEGGDEKSRELLLRRIIASEMALVMAATSPSAEQMEKLPEFDDAWAKKRVWVRGGGEAGLEAEWMQQRPEWRKPIVAGIQEALEKVLTAEQMQRYREEKEKQKAYEKEANVECLLVLLDDQLFLTEEQTEKVREGLRKHYRREGSLEMYLQNPQFFPPVPELAVIRHLSPKQRQIFKSLQQIDIGDLFGGENMVFEDDF